MIEANPGENLGGKTKKDKSRGDMNASKAISVDPPKNGIWPAATDGEIARLKAQPDWIWAGMFEVSRRLFARIEEQDEKIAALEGHPTKRKKKDSDVTPLD